MDVNEAKAAHEDELFAAPGVIGVAVGTEGGEDAIVVLVDEMKPDSDTPEKLGLPARLEGFPVVLREVGMVTAQE
jgi:hypothetical protein